MNFKVSIDINQPRDLVTQFWIDPNYLKEYQDGFIKKEPVSGVSGQTGAVSNMYYKMGKGRMELKETIVLNQLPDSFEGFYHHKHMDNTMKCTFTVLDESRTRYEMEIEYTRINWFMPKLMAILFPSMYRKQVEKWMKQFKTFVEKQ